MAIKNDVLRNINIYGIKFQTQLMFGLDTTPDENETLNELWDIHSDSTPGPNDKSFVQYFTLGNRGHRAVTVGDGFSDIELNQHYGEDAGLFQHIPLLARRINDDIDPDTRDQYGLRVPFERQGEDWVFYFAKALNLTNSSVETTKVTTNNGVETTLPFAADSGNLTPPVRTPPNPGNNVVNDTMLFALCNVPVTLTAVEIAEIRNACEVFFGDVKYAFVSEIGLVRACKKGVQLLDANRQPTGVQYFEAIQAVTVYFITGTWPIRFMDELDYSIDGGGGIPLIGPTQTTTVSD